MKMFAYPLLALLFVAGLSAPAKDKPVVVPYFDPATIDVKALLPDPPAVGSDVAKQEIELILQKQAARTPEEVARIKGAVKPNEWIFKDAAGAWYRKENLPITSALLERVDVGDEYPIIDAAKKFWDRPRPPKQDARVKPAIELPGNASYPSGHSTFATVTALILAELVPDEKEAILARGRQIGDDRVLAGVHFPTDVEAGRTLGQAIFKRLMDSAQFQADLAKAKAEIAAERAKG